MSKREGSSGAIILAVTVERQSEYHTEGTREGGVIISVVAAAWV